MAAGILRIALRFLRSVATTLSGCGITVKNLKPLTFKMAPIGSRGVLADVGKKLGFIPNLIAAFAHSPAVLNGYLALDKAWESSSLTARERQLIMLTAAIENHSTYCAAVHATALKSMRLDRQTIAAIRAKATLVDAKQDALVVVARALVVERGFIAPGVAKRFLAVGYNEVALMEVLMGVALSTLSNYLDHLNPLPIDQAFQGALE